MTLVKGKLHDGFPPCGHLIGCDVCHGGASPPLVNSLVPCSPHSLACSHLLNRITFRNCAPWVKNQVVTPWQLLTHSDQFVPENMQVR
jgi:hypothetical protein